MAYKNGKHNRMLVGSHGIHSGFRLAPVALVNTIGFGQLPSGDPCRETGLGNCTPITFNCMPPFRPNPHGRSRRLLGKQSRHPTSCERGGEHEAQRCARMIGDEYALIGEGGNDAPRLPLARAHDRVDIAARQFAAIQHGFENGLGLWR